MFTGPLRYCLAMGDNRYVGFTEAHHRGYLIAFTLHWQVIDARRINPATGASEALRKFIHEYENHGWVAEGEAKYGFVFMNRNGQRILLEATPRDPFDTSVQTFSPFK